MIAVSSDETCVPVASSSSVDFDEIDKLLWGGADPKPSTASACQDPKPSTAAAYQDLLEDLEESPMPGQVAAAFAKRTVASKLKTTSVF